jgi:protein involved in polysaccharide export with SLBB domain
MKFLGELLGIACVLFLASCSPSGSELISADIGNTPVRNRPPVTVPTVAVSHAEGNITANGVSNSAGQGQLQALWYERTHDSKWVDYPIGPGDVVAISVPAMEELKERSVRVAADGTIALPLVGVVRAGGLTEEQFREELASKLRKYMYHPQVDVFVKQYRSREVAVLGAVKTPGLVTLKSPSDTILDAIANAGGVLPDAGDQLVFFPGGSGSSVTDLQAPPTATNGVAPASASGPSDFGKLAHRDGAFSGRGVASAKASRGSAVAISPGSTSFVIALRSTSLTSAGPYINMPVRPGDVIVVPGGGDVMVIGWVQNPGHFQIGSGLTVLGAIGAAGGPMYAANTANIQLIRTAHNGEKVVIPIDLDKVINGSAPDLSVQGNDVIDVPYSGAKIGPYIVYQIVTKLGYGIGLGLPTI